MATIKEKQQEIDNWIKANFKFNYQRQIKAIINDIPKDTIPSILEKINSGEYTAENFITNIRNLQKKQKQKIKKTQNKSQENKKEKTGAKDMDTDNQEKTENNNVNFLEFSQKKPHINKDEIYDAFALYKKDPKEFEQRYPHPKVTIGDGSSIPTTQPENTDDGNWINTVIKYYQEQYKEHLYEPVAIDNGIHFEVSPHTNKEQQLTGTAISYLSQNHVEIQKTKEGVEPKDQSFQHFQDHIAALKKLGNTEIALGQIQSSKFCTKVVAAALANGIDNITLENNQEHHKLDFSAETLKGIPVKTQTKLIEYALKNDVQIEFGENSPLLDFNNEAIQALPDELKIKYLCMLLANDKIKDKIKNAPKPIKLEALKERVIGKNADGSDITAGDVHNKVNELRGRIKGGESRQEVLKEVKAETHGNNYFQYAQKHTQQKR